MGVVRVLLLADTHLGFDLPFRPRVKRRRRGADFFANFERALEPALRREVDLVVHGGDLLYRSRVPLQLVHMALEPLRRVASLNVSVRWLQEPMPRGKRQAASTTLEVSADAGRGHLAHDDGQLGLAGAAHAPHRAEA